MFLYLLFFLIFAFIFSLSFWAFPRSGQELRPQLIAELIEKKKKRPFFLPLLDILDPINRRLGSPAFRENIAGRLTASGSTLTVNEFFALKELCAIILPAIVVISFVVLANATAPIQPEGAILGFVISLLQKIRDVVLHPIFITISALIGIFTPHLWLMWKIARRHRAIIKSMPDIIDLLNLTVGAGLDFMSAMNMVVKKSRSGHLTRELFSVCQEVRMGKSRREALRGMAKRIGLPDVSSFVRTLVQADRMGTSIEEALRIHSEEARAYRFERGERQALKAPLKMLIPLVFCILPVVAIIVGGPIFLQFQRLGFGFLK